MSGELKTCYLSSLESQTHIPSPRRFSCSSQFLASSLSQYKHKTSLNYDQTSCQDLSTDQHQDHLQDPIQKNSKDSLLDLNLMQDQAQDNTQHHIQDHCQDHPQDNTQHHIQDHCQDQSQDNTQHHIQDHCQDHHPQDNIQHHLQDHCQDHPQCSPQTHSQDYPQCYPQIQPQDHLLNHYEEYIQIIAENHPQNNFQGFPLDRIQNRPEDNLFDHIQDHHYLKDHSKVYSVEESDQNKYPHLCHPSECRYHFNHQDNLQDMPNDHIQDYQQDAQGLSNINQESYSLCSSDDEEAVYIEKNSDDHQDQQSNQLSDSLKDHQLIPLSDRQSHQHLNDHCENFPDFQDQQFDQIQKQKEHNHHFQERLSDQNHDLLFGNILDHKGQELTFSPGSLHDLCEAVPANICPEDHSTQNLRCPLNSWLTSSDQMLDSELDSRFPRCTCIYKAAKKEMIADKSTMERKKSFFFRNSSCHNLFRNCSKLQADSHNMPRGKSNYSNKTLEDKVRSWSSNLMCTCDDILTCTCQPHLKCTCIQECTCDVQDEFIGVIELKTGIYLI